ncbi:MAG TPA: hypothetical protein H9829_00325 [Candidatus Tetragenococcus pullicola]|nr:hypothetical protein [Candidatus Tetragenococcus pullicola]
MKKIKNEATIHLVCCNTLFESSHLQKELKEQFTQQQIEKIKGFAYSKYVNQAYDKFSAEMEEILSEFAGITAVQSAMIIKFLNNMFLTIEDLNAYNEGGVKLVTSNALLRLSTPATCAEHDQETYAIEDVLSEKEVWPHSLNCTCFFQPAKHYGYPNDPPIPPMDPFTNEKLMALTDNTYDTWIDALEKRYGVAFIDHVQKVIQEKVYLRK